LTFFAESNIWYVRPAPAFPMLMTLFCVIYCFSGSDIGVRQGGDLADGTSQFTPEDEQGTAVSFLLNHLPKVSIYGKVGYDPY
jgi:hypothetical protein